MTSVSLFASATRFPARERGERRIESRGADDGVEHDVHVVAPRGLDEARRRRRASPACGVGAVPRRCRRSPARNARPARRAARVVERRERGDAESVALPLEHAERRRADRAGRPEDRDAARRRSRCVTTAPRSACQPSSTYATGSTKSRLSKRSRTPPWPGMSVELSFTPASRLSSDSARSPTCAATLTSDAEREHADRRAAKIEVRRRAQARTARRAHATSMLASSPPTAPSTVFPGLTDGMSLCRPIVRPTAYAPMSDAQVSRSGSSSSSPPDGTANVRAPSVSAAGANA